MEDEEEENGSMIYEAAITDEVFRPPSILICLTSTSFLTQLPSFLPPTLLDENDGWLSLHPFVGQLAWCNIPPCSSILLFLRASERR